jgi:metal-responsive CopG/Arc/MetJ family transcriptional regulator
VKDVSVTLPEAMIELVDRTAGEEHRTRSELVQEALGWYLLRLPTEELTPDEIAQIEAGFAEVDRGEYVILDDLAHDLAPDSVAAGRDG